MDYKMIIKKEMAKKNLTYDEMAKRAGMTRQGLWTTLNGRKNNSQTNKLGSKSVRFETVERLCDALGLRLVICRKKEFEEQN